MKKKLIIAVLASCLSLFAMGCSNSTGSGNLENNTNQSENIGNNAKESQNIGSSSSISDTSTITDKEDLPKAEEPKGEKVKYTLLLTENLPEDYKTAIGFINKNRGYGIFREENDGLSIYIGSGEKPTAAHDIAVDSVRKVDDTIIITVSESGPGEDEMSSQVISYPYTIVKIYDSNHNIKVVNSQGEEFTDINGENEE